MLLIPSASIAAEISAPSSSSPQSTTMDVVPSVIMLQSALPILRISIFNVSFKASFTSFLGVHAANKQQKSSAAIIKQAQILVINFSPSNQFSISQTSSSHSSLPLSQVCRFATPRLKFFFHNL